MDEALNTDSSVPHGFNFPLGGEEFMQFVCLYESRLHDLYRTEFLKYETSPGMAGAHHGSGYLWEVAIHIFHIDMRRAMEVM